MVRRTPLYERLKTMLNPMDFLLWLSEEIETREINSKVVGTQLGLAMNFAFLLASANSSSKTTVDDVFGDDEAGSGFLTFFVSFLALPASDGTGGDNDGSHRAVLLMLMLLERSTRSSGLSVPLLR
jgi:hypothetical protein